MRRVLGVVIGAAFLAVLVAPSVAAAQAPADAAAYIDTKNNSDVKNNSNCQSPDKFDRQPGISSIAGNQFAVRVYGCLYEFRNDPGNRSTFDGPVSFDLSGVGEIEDCPDPDGTVNGRIFYLQLDDNRDAISDRCWFESFSPRLGQFLAVVDNDQDTGPGTTTVTFCHDPTRNTGCARNAVKDELTIVWAAGQAAPGGGNVPSGGDVGNFPIGGIDTGAGGTAADEGAGAILPLALGAVALAGVALLLRRRRA